MSEEKSKSEGFNGKANADFMNWQAQVRDQAEKERNQRRIVDPSKIPTIPHPRDNETPRK